jgi:hypothetical protein
MSRDLPTPEPPAATDNDVERHLRHRADQLRALGREAQADLVSGWAELLALRARADDGDADSDRA